VLRYSGGRSHVPGQPGEPRDESRWWTSPLPPPGPVEFTLFPDGVTGPAHSACLDAALIVQAAGAVGTVSGSGGMTKRHDGADTPPGGVIPATVPGDVVVVLVRRAGLVTLASAITVFPAGFEFTLSTLSDVSRVDPPASFALDVPHRSQEAWLAVRFSDGRYRAADLNANTPGDQPDGPHLRMQDGEASSTEGWDISRWWVTPLPPPGR